MSKAKKIEIALVGKLMKDTSLLQKRQVSDRIALAMKIEGLIKSKFGSYTDFAKHIKRSPTEVSRWVSGTHNLTQSTLSEIAMGLDVELIELFTKREMAQPIVLNYKMNVKDIKPSKWNVEKSLTPHFSIKID